jgi:hypothetical protein
MAQSESPSAYRAGPSLIERDRLEHGLGQRRARALRSAWDRAKQVAKDEERRDAIGQSLYADPERVGRAWAALLPFVERR